MATHLYVNPGICGFPCRIAATRQESRSAAVDITETDCKQIKKLAEAISVISLKELFLPIGKNPVYTAAHQAGCHPSCLIPAAIIKALEVELGLALPRQAEISFETKTGGEQEKTNLQNLSIESSVGS